MPLYSPLSLSSFDDWVALVSSPIHLPCPSTALPLSAPHFTHGTRLGPSQKTDPTITVWNWRTGEKMASARSPSPTTSLFFLPPPMPTLGSDSDSAHTFVTASTHSIKYWTITTTLSVAPPHVAATPPAGRPIPSPTTTPATPTATVTIDSRPANLANFRDKSLAAAAGGMPWPAGGVVWGGEVYAVTETGTLVMVGSGGVQKWVEMKVPIATSVQTTPRFVFCGCADGVVRAFQPGTLQYIATLPKLPTEGSGTGGTPPVFSDVVALSAASRVDSGVVCVAYADGSVVVWDMALDGKKVEKVDVFQWRKMVGGMQVSVGIEGASAATLTPGSPPTTPGSGTAALKRPAKELSKVVGLEEPWVLADVTGDGVWAVAVDEGGVARIFMPWNASHKPVVLSPQPPTPTALAAQSLPTNRLQIAVGCSDGSLVVYSARIDRCHLVQTYKDHASSITAVLFAEGGRKLVAAGWDGIVVVRVRERDDAEYLVTHTIRLEVPIHNISLDPANRHLVILTDPRTVSVYSLASAKCLRVYTEETDPDNLGAKDDVVYRRASVHPSGLIMGVAGSDGIVRVLDFWSGDCIGTLEAASPPLAGLFFSPCEKRAVVLSEDGNIAVFRLPPSAIREARARLNAAGTISTVKELEPTGSTRLGFSDDNLPSWARAAFRGDRDDKQTDREQTFKPPVVKGRWAERLGENDRVVLFSEEDGGRVARLDDWKRRRFTLPPGTPGGRGGADEDSESDDDDEQKSDGSSTVRFDIGENDTFSAPFLLQSRVERLGGLGVAVLGDTSNQDIRPAPGYSTPTRERDTEPAKSSVFPFLPSNVTSIGQNPNPPLPDSRAPLPSLPPPQPPANTIESLEGNVPRKLSDPSSQSTTGVSTLPDLPQPRSKSVGGGRDATTQRQGSVNRTSSDEVDRIRQRLQSLGITWRPASESGSINSSQVSLQSDKPTPLPTSSGFHPAQSTSMNTSPSRTEPIVQLARNANGGLILSYGYHLFRYLLILPVDAIRAEFQSITSRLQSLKLLESEIAAVSGDRTDEARLLELRRGFENAAEIVNGTNRTSERRTAPLTMSNPRVREFMDTVLKMVNEL
ncbi:Mitogen-activated protein kinase-binding protein 1 [Gonapodya sp. JEL0774]|nr:Mitogen-activated protein kinase-binding protein 1 [Gonapodya sp. JEL0774]